MHIDVDCQTDSVNEQIWIENEWKKLQKNKILIVENFNHSNETLPKNLIQTNEAMNQSDDESESEFIIVSCSDGQNSTLNSNSNEVYEKISTKDDSSIKEEDSPKYLINNFYKSNNFIGLKLIFFI